VAADPVHRQYRHQRGGERQQQTRKGDRQGPDKTERRWTPQVNEDSLLKAQIATGAELTGDLGILLEGLHQ
jgi:hypothetical protein